MKLLNTGASNTKIAKTQKLHDAVRLASLSLMPHPQICAGSKAAGCFDDCLKSSGRGRFNNVANARQNKTDYWLDNRPAFLSQLERELFNFDKLCKKQNVSGWVRLNTISDISWEDHQIPQSFPALNFYDYTKRVARFDKLPANYQLILSYSGRRQYQKTVARRPVGVSLAVVFKKYIPQFWNGERVIDGDKSDLINLKAGCVVGLLAKGRAVHNTNDFVVDPDLVCAG